jgi:hypothetical protein
MAQYYFNSVHRRKQLVYLISCSLAVIYFSSVALGIEHGDYWLLKFTDTPGSCLLHDDDKAENMKSNNLL